MVIVFAETNDLYFKTGAMNNERSLDDILSTCKLDFSLKDSTQYKIVKISQHGEGQRFPPSN